MHVPHPLEKLGAGHYLIASEQKVLEERKLLRRQPDLLSIHEDLPREPVQDQVGAREGLRPFRAAPPHQGADPRSKVLDDDRLRDVVIRASVKQANGRLPVGIPRQHQYRSRSSLSAERLDDGDPVSIGQAEIQHDALVVVHERETERLGARVRHVDGESVLLEDASHEKGKRGVVFDEQGSHIGGLDHGDRERTRCGKHDPTYVIRFDDENVIFSTLFCNPDRRTLAVFSNHSTLGVLSNDRPFRTP